MIALLQQVLDNTVSSWDLSKPDIVELKKAIEFELAKPDQPLAWINGNLIMTDEQLSVPGIGVDFRFWKPLYTHPPRQQEALTQAAIIDAWQRKLSGMSDAEKDECNVVEFIRGARFAERSHGIGGEK